MASILNVDQIKNAAGTSAMTIDSSGHVLTSVRPAFVAYPTNSGNTQSATSVLPYSIALLNVGNCYNTSTYKFTAPVTGLYFVAFSVWTGSSTVTRCAFYVNNAKHGDSVYGIGTRTDANSNQNDSAQTVMSLTASDVVDIRVYAGDVNIFGSNFFMGYLLG